MRHCLFILPFLLVQGLSATEGDILDYATAHQKGHETVQQPDGSYKASKYGDHKLASAEIFLKEVHPRPWTITLALEWYRTVEDDVTRCHLLRLLAASRDPRAALALATAFESKSQRMRVAGCYGLLDYFLPHAVAGGTESHMVAVRDWLDDNKERLHTEAAKK